MPQNLYIRPPDGLGLKDQPSFLVATSAGIDQQGKTYVVLHWHGADKVIAYNLYRRKGVALGRQVCINGKKNIRPVQNCAELKAVVPEGSFEWQMLSAAFTSSGAKDTLKITSAPGSLPHLTLKGEPVIIDSTVSLGSVVGKLLPALQVDPCEALEQGLTEEQITLWEALAAANLRIRQTRGLAYIDDKVTANEQYVYELHGVTTDGSELVLAKDVDVVAGQFVLPGPPSGFGAEAGDGKTLSTWNRNSWAFSYSVRRSLNPAGPFQVINSEPIVYDIKTKLNGAALAHPLPAGFLDFQRWNPDGLPVSHKVDGIDVDGPTNGITYYYEVASRDILDRTGPWSAPQNATPIHTTPPMAPDNFRIDPCASPPGLALSWRKVIRDVQNHKEPSATQTYRIYRADNANDLFDSNAMALHHVATVTANPNDPAHMIVGWTDLDPVLTPPYGEKDFWYRVQCVDENGNAGAPSVQVSGRVPDTHPPGGTEVTGSEGFADRIRITWDLNSEPDLAGYQIYRSVCDKGHPFRPREDKEKLLGCDFMLVGDVSRVNAEEQQKKTGSAYFDDYSAPPGSPLCYAYWVRAYDWSGNLYEGDEGCPADREEYVCQRLYEETPPPVPIITGLKARNNSVQIDWISSPIQDLRAFHVYRGKEEHAKPDFVGCVLSDGSLWPGRWNGTKPSCEDIPAEPNPATVYGTFLDKGMEPNQVYWYRVSALDWLGNESEGDNLLKIPAISTFTYRCDPPGTPVVLPPSGSAQKGCSQVVSWTPTFDKDFHQGFLVFRSGAVSGGYRQVSPIVRENKYADVSALHDIDYWYRIQAIDKYGKLSEPSAPVKYRY